MPNYRTSDRDRIIREDEFQTMYRHLYGLMERSWIVTLWLTAARPDEAIQIIKRDIVIEPDKTKFRLHTSKLGKSTTQIPRHRNLALKIPADNEYIMTLQSFLNRFKNDDARLFPFSLKTGYNIVNRISLDVLGISLCPYNFRHSRMTILGEHGASEEKLKQFKGAFTTESVRPYLHLREVEYTVEV